MLAPFVAIAPKDGAARDCVKVGDLPDCACTIDSHAHVSFSLMTKLKQGKRELGARQCRARGRAIADLARKAQKLDRILVR